MLRAFFAPGCRHGGVFVCVALLVMLENGMHRMFCWMVWKSWSTAAMIPPVWPLALEGGIRVVKSKGRLAELRKRLAVEALARSGCGIGHTRWATHGEPSDVNSHPHSTPRVSIVHNGIIENYGVLKERLMAKGYTFESETDTEVLVKLIDSCYEGEPLKAPARRSPAMVRGSYALAVLFRDFPDTLFAVKRGEPAHRGLGRRGKLYCVGYPGAAEIYPPVQRAGRGGTWRW